MKTLLKSGKACIDGSLVDADILIEGEKISAIGKNLNADKIIDLRGKIILPGLIDCHVHMREPGHTHKEDFLTGSKAAAGGGVTTFLDMPNNNPLILSENDLNEKRKLAKKSIVNYGFYIGATKDNIKNLNKIKNIAGIKAFLGSSTGNLLLDNALDFVNLMKETDKLVIVHAEDEKIIKELSEKYKSTKMHHLIRDNIAALKATARAVTVAKEYNKKLHVTHLSTKEEIEFLRNNKDENITCDVTPHHLLLNYDFFVKKGNIGKMNPPLRSEEDRLALWEAINDGTVDCIATDHAPHTMEEKNQDYEKAPSGVPGIQTMLPLLLNEVSKGKLTLGKLVELCCKNPARIFKIKHRGEIKVGNYADFVVVDLNKKETLKNEDMLSKCKWTPFDGMKVTGMPIMTIVNGNIVYDNGKTADLPAQEVSYF